MSDALCSAPISISVPPPHIQFAAMGFEKMRVYQAAQMLDQEVQSIIAEIKAGARKGYAKDLNHLDRSLASVLTNVPEAYASPPNGVQRQHLEVARVEVDEVRGALRRLVANGFVTEKRIRRACELTSVIAKMLTAWIKTLPE